MELTTEFDGPSGHVKEFASTANHGSAHRFCIAQTDFIGECLLDVERRWTTCQVARAGSVREHPFRLDSDSDELTAGASDIARCVSPVCFPI